MPHVKRETPATRPTRLQEIIEQNRAKSTGPTVEDLAREILDAVSAEHAKRSGMTDPNIARGLSNVRIDKIPACWAYASPIHPSAIKAIIAMS